jgi:hypothetical protein
VSVKKEDRARLNTSNLLKLSQSGREGGTDKFAFFEADGKVGSDFKAVYDLHMRIEALSKALMFFDMKDVFEIIPEHTIDLLEVKLQNMFRNQADLQEAEDRMLLNATDADLQTDQRLATQAVASSIQALNAVEITTIDLFSDFKLVDETTIRRSNTYYAQYGAEYTVENLSWSTDHILNTCEEPLRDKI